MPRWRPVKPMPVKMVKPVFKHPFLRSLNNSKAIYKMPLKFIVVLLAGCLFGFNSAAQTTTTLYEFEYHFAQENKVYKAFLSRNKNATGFIRLAFNNNQNLPVVIEMQLYQ